MLYGNVRSSTVTLPVRHILRRRTCQVRLIIFDGVLTISIYTLQY